MLRKLRGLWRSGKIGNKASYLQFLLKRGYAVPTTFVIPWNVYEAFLVRGHEVLEDLEAAVARCLDDGRSYAVRSSASVEDSPQYSFAGQFLSVLDVTGKRAVLDAVQEVWKSARSASAKAYAEKGQVPDVEIKMAVIIQEMVRPVVSGVAFSKNPVTGMDETIVEAVSGKGTSLVQEGARPWRWVWKWGKWLEEPSGTGAHNELAKLAVEGTQSIAAALGRPVDLEWVYDGKSLYWVQLRPITALPERNVYSNRISREFLPGIIKPLVWSVNVPLVNGAWISLITELIGPNDLEPEELSKAFYYRAYFNMGAMGRVLSSLGMRPETLELLMGLDGGEDKPSFKPSREAGRHLPRMMRCAIGKLFYERRLELLLPELRRQFRESAAKPLNGLSETQLLQEVTRLFAVCQKAVYANIVAPLLMQIYNVILERQLRTLHVNPREFDLTNGLDGWDEFDPKPSLAELHRHFASLDAELQGRIRTATYEQFLEIPGIETFQDSVARFIEQFGHLSDSGNDFSSAPWKEQRELVLQMAAGFEQADSAPAKLTWEDLNAGRLRRLCVGPFYRRARKYRFYREAIGFYYTLGYGLFRRLFLALAERFASRGILGEPEDIFYLYWDEVRELAARGASAEKARGLIRQRQEEIEAVQNIVLPDIIFGEVPPPTEEKPAEVTRLEGIPTSSGYFRGPVRVIRGIAEFVRMTPGAVAVIPYSDVSWTPLIVKAGAVVAESGGTLSHTSIVARECGIPAVVSVTDACKRLQNGMEVSVDGFKGEIVVLNARQEA